MINFTMKCLEITTYAKTPMNECWFSFVEFSLLCYEFCILSKTECKRIYYHFRRDHESSSFRKQASNKWIFQETCDIF